MECYELSNKQARRFLFFKHGLLGKHKFTGKQGILDFVKQVGCIQFDPVDICGKNAELVLQSRVKGFTKSMLDELLYKDRQLIDYGDKNLSIMHVNDWKHFGRIRDVNKIHGRSKDIIAEVESAIAAIIREKGAVSSADIGFNEVVNWYWSDTRLSRAALETMYFRGDLVVHHKKGTIKYYDFAENHIPQEILNAPEPLPDDNEYQKWRTLRRIGAVGLLWNRPSDAWLGIHGMKTAERNKIFPELIDENKIIPLKVENIKDSLYCLVDNIPLIEYILGDPKLKARTEFIAPLDNMMWDRKLIGQVFDFHYKWEIYTPAADLKYGHYVLPILHGDKFAGRIEMVNNRKESILEVKNIWLDTDCDLDETLSRFAKFNNCNDIKIY